MLENPRRTDAGAFAYAAAAPPSNVWSHRLDVLRELIARDMKLRYRGSFFGMAWTLLNPLAELLVLSFVFSAVLPLEIPNYSVFLFVGLLVYNWFLNSLFFSTVVVVANRDLIRRPDVPAALLPVVSVASTMLHFILSLPVLFLLLYWRHVPVTSAVAALPLLMIAQFVFTLALAYPLAAIHVWFRDTQYLLRVGLQLLFYLTPVFYDVSSIPAQYQGWFRLNPMSWVLDGYRDVLIRGVLPPLGEWLAIAGGSLVLLGIGYSLFRAVSARFADEV